MIRVARPPTKPEILLTKGAEHTEQDKAAYDTDPDGYCSANKTFKSKKTIYGHKSVKRALRDVQHSKCCYCEAKFGATYYGDVEHYRPKGAVKQSEISNKEYPGYYWLAYDWDNLLVSCKICNTDKGCLFPLIDETTRARNHRDDIEKEQPVFINPVIDDPREHIIFRREEPIPITERGLKTIEYLKLRRPDLQEARREWLTVLEDLRDLIVAGENSDNPNMLDQTKKAKKHLEKVNCPEAQFSSMAKDFLES